ncbi:MAG: hypothetical protein FJ279_04610 [Planctomycetes bacterium]|nr:hypothetical protein [Planctomycetota bacterium]
MTMAETHLHEIRSRHQMIRFFDGYAIERMEELDERRLKRPLVKTQLLEVLGGNEAHTDEGLRAIFGRRQVTLMPIETSLFLAVDDQTGQAGLLERLHPRIVALYSTMKSDDMQQWVRRLVMRSPELDYVWLSGLTFGVLWQLVTRLSRSHRFTRLVFTHESVFDIDQAASEPEEEEEETPQDSAEEEMADVIERRATSFRLVDRIGVIQQKLEALQKIYSPLYAISQLRFPSPVGRGGHDFYDNGRVTNKTESFRDHRSHLLFVVRIYERLLRSTEEQAWYSIQDSVGVPGQFRKIVGSPVVVRFREPLSRDVFDYWIGATFERKRNRFRLWGHPIRLGPTKVHVYGVDRHLWQPLFLELTANGCTAIIPNGTCGNTVHRLVTNIQRYLDPGAEAFVGDKPYKRMVEESAQGVPYDLGSE